VNTEQPNAIVRSGTAEDIMFLVGLYRQLEPQAQRALLVDSAYRLAQQLASATKGQDGKSMSVEDWLPMFNRLGNHVWNRSGKLLAYLESENPIPPSCQHQDIINLISLYDQGDKSQLLSAAAEAFVGSRLNGLCGDDGEVLEAREWLALLATETRPHGDEVGRMLAFAAGVCPDWEEAIFNDGALSVVLYEFGEEYAQAEGIYAGYTSIRSNTSAMYEPPDPAELFQISVSKMDFTDWTGEEEEFDSEAWGQEIYHRCVLEIASYVRGWRSNFFGELVSGTPLHKLL